MDISSLLSPSDELTPTTPSPNSRPNGSHSDSSVRSLPASIASTHDQRRSAQHTPDMDTASSGDVAMDDAVAPPDSGEPLSEDDYKEIGTVLETIQLHPYQYSAHVQCIGLLRRAFLTAPRNDRHSMLAELRNARESMISIFPMIENMWLEWIEDEQSEALSLDDRLKVMELCARAVTDQVASVKLFKAYGDFVEAQTMYAENSGGRLSMRDEELSEFKELFQHEVVVDTYRQGATATFNDIASSHLLWDKYRDLLMQDLAAAPSAEGIEHVYRIYRDRLRVPHTTIASTFSAFSQFVTRYDNANYEDTMVKFNKIYAAAYEKYRQREEFEDALKREVDQNKTPGAEEWRIWSEYLDWETSQPRKKLDEKLASALYERCLLRFGEQAKVWEDYVFFLLEKAQNSMPKVISVLQRATRHCPWSGALWAQHIVALEKGFKPFEEVSEVKHKATKTELLDLGGHGEVLKVNIAWCGFLKRRAFEHDSGEEDLDMAEMGINEAVTESENGKFQDPDYRLQRIQINFYTAANKLDRARAIWQDLSKSKGTSYIFWLRYYNWELANGTKENAGNLIKRALGVKTLDWPETILETWRTHVEDFGDIGQVENMMVKHRRFAIEIAEKREKDAQAQAQTQAQVQTQAQTQQYPELEERNGKRRRSDVGDEAQPNPKKAKAKSEDAPAPQAPVAAVALVNQAPPTTTQLVKRDREHTTIIVRNLPPGYTELKVRQYFRDCGTINSLRVLNEATSSTATVEFESKDDVATAQTRHGKTVDGRQIEIQVGTGTTLYVTNFPPIADEAYIRGLFKDCGEIVDIRFPSLRFDTHRRFCYVQFSTAAGAQNATRLDGTQLGEKEHLVAKISAPNQKKDRTSPTTEGREVYIRNIDFRAKDSDVKNVFDKFGAVEKVHLPPGPKRGTHKGYGFVVFARKEDADRSLEANGVALKSRALEVSIAQVNPGKPTKPGNAITAPPDSPPEDASPTPSFDDIKKKTLGVLHLADTVNDTRLRSLFSPFGTLRKVQLRPEHQGAVVEYENVADAGRAALAMQGREVDGMTLRISDLEELMKETPRGRVLKGFVAAPRKALGAPVVPASGRGAGRGGRRGLGFVGAIVARREEGGGKVEEKGEEGGKGRSNEDFKKMFLAGK